MSRQSLQSPGFVEQSCIVRTANLETAKMLIQGVFSQSDSPLPLPSTQLRHNLASGQQAARLVRLQPKPIKNAQEAQEIVCNFFLEVVKHTPPESALREFRQLFIEPMEAFSSEVYRALLQIISTNNEAEFRNTLKRSSYILINNWSATRHYQPIQELVQLHSTALESKTSASLAHKRLKLWRTNFVESKDYQELRAFVAKYDRDKGHWSDRYSSYMLVSQAVNENNSPEQREAARIRSEQLKEQFKFDLAMYTARSQSQRVTDANNPTAIGDEVLRLIKLIVARRGKWSYPSLANIFLKQTKTISYKDFKKCLIDYLIYSVNNQGLAESLKTQLSLHLESLYESYHDEEWNRNLLLRTCNRVIEYFTMENPGEPSPLFSLLATQGNSLTLVVILLKIILICKPAYTRLECCLANLIRHYESAAESECQWLIQFLEILKVTLTIYAENVQYNLVNMEDATLMTKDGNLKESAMDVNICRVFSQVKQQRSESSTLPKLQD